MAGKSKLASFVKTRPGSLETGQPGGEPPMPHNARSNKPGQVDNFDSIWDNAMDDISELTSTPKVHSRSDAGNGAGPEMPPPIPFHPAGLKKEVDLAGDHHPKRSESGPRTPVGKKDRPPQHHHVDLYSHVPSSGEGQENIHGQARIEEPASRTTIQHISNVRHQPRLVNPTIPAQFTDVQLDRWKTMVVNEPASLEERARSTKSRTSPTVSKAGPDVDSQPGRTGNGYRSAFYDTANSISHSNEPKGGNDRPPLPTFTPPTAGVDPARTGGGEATGDGRQRESEELDYDSTSIRTMPYSTLRQLPFDEDPSVLGHSSSGRDAALSGAASGFIKPSSAALPDRLASVLYASGAQQTQLLEALPFADWEDAGDWIIDQMGTVMKRLASVRKEKRRLMLELEDEIYARHELVEMKKGKIEEALSGMRRNGGVILRENISAPK